MSFKNLLVILFCFYFLLWLLWISETCQSVHNVGFTFCRYHYITWVGLNKKKNLVILSLDLPPAFLESYSDFCVYHLFYLFEKQMSGYFVLWNSVIDLVRMLPTIFMSLKRHQLIVQHFLKLYSFVIITVLCTLTHYSKIKLHFKIWKKQRVQMVMSSVWNLNTGNSLSVGGFYVMIF